MIGATEQAHNGRGRLRETEQKLISCENLRETEQKLKSSCESEQKDEQNIANKIINEYPNYLYKCNIRELR